MSNLSRIGRVPRVNPVVFPPDHPLVDQFNQPTTWEDRSCELVPAKWPTHYTLERTLRDYAREHAVPDSGKDEDGSFWYGFDCSHCDDMAPGIDYRTDGVYRTFEYVQDEIRSLARQLQALVVPEPV